TASGGGLMPSDAFVTKLNPSGSALVNSSYLARSTSAKSRAFGGTPPLPPPGLNPLAGLLRVACLGRARRSIRGVAAGCNRAPRGSSCGGKTGASGVELPLARALAGPSRVWGSELGSRGRPRSLGATPWMLIGAVAEDGAGYNADGGSVRAGGAHGKLAAS